MPRSDRPTGRRAATRLVPELPRTAWILLGGAGLSALGTGMTLPFLLVYLSQVRGIDMALAGLAVSTVALAGFVGNPLGGWLADRTGPRNALAAGLVVAAAGAFALAGVDETWHGFGAAAVVGLGAAICWPAQDTLLSTVVPPDQRSGVFAVRHAAINAGFGMGGLVAAAFVQVSSPGTFELLYVVDGLSFLAFVPVLFAMRVGTRAEAEPRQDGGFRTVFADRVFMRVWLLTALLVAVCYAQYHAAFPAFATDQGGLSAGDLGIVFAVNTFVVAGAQLVSLRAMAGRRRTRGLALVGVAVAGGWAVALLAGGLGGGAAALAAFSLAMLLLALAETFVSPTLPPLVNDLAPDRLRGRYNGVSTLAWTTGFAAGPAVAGVAVAGHAEALFLGFIVCCGFIAVGALRLERRLPRAVNLVPPASTLAAK
jgi:MFS family permease